MEPSEGTDHGPVGAGKLHGVDEPLPPAGSPTSGLISATASMVAFKILSAGAVGVVGVITARRLEPAGRGVFVLLVTMASFGVLLSSLGVNMSARLHLVTPVNRIPSGDYLGLSAVLTGVQVLMCVALSLTLLPAVDVRLSMVDMGLFGVLGAAMFAQYMLNDALNAYGFTTLATKVELTGSVMQLSLVVMLAAAGEESVMPFIAALAAASAGQAVLGVAMLRRAGIQVRPTADVASWRRLLRNGLPAIPTALGQVLTFRADRYLVGLFMNPAAVGVYSVAATAPELLRLPALALSQPMLYRLASGRARIRDFKRIRFFLLAATVVSAATVAALAPMAVRVVFGAEYTAAVTPLRILLLGEVGIAVFYLDGSALAGSNRIRDAALAAVAGLAIVAALDLLLIQRFELAGAAWASVAAYSVMGAVAAVLLRRVHRAA